MQNKLIAAAAGLVSYGVLIGWAFTADHYEQKLKEKQENIDLAVENLRSKNAELKDMLVRKLQSVDESDEEGWGQLELPLEGEKSPEGETDGTSVTGEDNGEVDEAETEVIRKNLQSLIDTYTNNPDDIDVFVDRASAPLTKREHTPPYVISRDQYAGWDDDEESANHEKITLTYYPNHRVLLDDDDEVIENVDMMIGWRSLSSFGGESGDPDVVFVRNSNLMSDFEVVRDDENDLPLHVKYGMPRDEFEVNKAAGLIRFRPEDT